MSERRREARLANTASSFIIKDARGAEIPCAVKNISRRGIGIALPTGMKPTEFPVGTEISGKLVVDNKSFETKAAVRVSHGDFRGLEFIKHSQDFRNGIGRVLSPKYIASSITPLNTTELANHLEYAFRGNEFEVLAFKTGRSGVQRMLQIFAAGNIVEVSGSSARSVPAPLVRRVGDDSDYSFMSEFTEVEDGFATLNLAEFFSWIQEIVNEWPSCPPDFRKAIAEQLAANKQ